MTQLLLGGLLLSLNLSVCATRLLPQMGLPTSTPVRSTAMNHLSLSLTLSIHIYVYVYNRIRHMIGWFLEVQVENFQRVIIKRLGRKIAVSLSHTGLRSMVRTNEDIDLWMIHFVGLCVCRKRVYICGIDTWIIDFVG